MRGVIFFSMIFSLCFTNHEGEWGFFGHRLINELAVFTLPPPMIKYYKKNIEYLRDHAVDPDKRRHASVHEAVKHYIDIDHWGLYPYNEVPRDFHVAVLNHATFYGHRQGHTDTFSIIEKEDVAHCVNNQQDTIFTTSVLDIRKVFLDHFMPSYYSENWKVEVNDEMNLWPYLEIEVIDEFSEYGVLPYNLVSMYYSLQSAMKNKNHDLLLRLSADIGHYIADAHVPLHTTENYNGQLTGQEGIHAFWESRIPELFANNTYDLFAGKAEYIPDIKEYIWDIVLESNQLVDSVLNVERRLRMEFPQDQQYCYDDRNGFMVRQPCPAYAFAYQSALKGMVEERMRASIKSLGDIWYSAWIEAGQPDLLNNSSKVNDTELQADTIKVNNLGSKWIRGH